MGTQGLVYVKKIKKYICLRSIEELDDESEDNKLQRRVKLWERITKHHKNTRKNKK